MENYEDPINLKLTNNMATTNSPPPPSHFQGPQREISLEEGLYAETLLTQQQELGESLANMSMDWGTVYTTPPKGGIMKVSTLSYVKIKGPLEKLGGNNCKTWQRRYCVLSGALMYFYEKENSKTYNNCITVPSFKVSNAPNITSEKKKQFGFKLTKEDSSTGKSKDYYFRASTIEFRDKWVSCIKNVGMTNQADNLLSPSAFLQANSVTLPRMSSQASPISPPTVPQRERRAHSEGVEEEGEVYEELVVPEDRKEIIEEDDGVYDEYIAVCPEDDRVVELESSEEYVAIVPLAVVEEDKTNNQRPPPPPPLLPPSGPHSEVFTHPTTQAVPFFKPPAPPPPPSEPEVDTNRVYLKDNSNGIVLEKVYVSQWNFAAVEGDELELKRGDLLFVSKPLDSEMWWYGELLDAEASRKVGLAGFFPKDYSTLAFEALSCQ